MGGLAEPKAKYKNPQYSLANILMLTCEYWNLVLVSRWLEAW